MEKSLRYYLPDASAPEEIGVEQSADNSSGQGAYQLVREQDVQRVLLPRASFSHKGTYGHALLIAGAAQTMGAALLCAKGCLYAGAGLTTLSIPESGLTALNCSLPEVMYLSRSHISDDLNQYTAIAVGPGLGTGSASHSLLHDLLLMEKAMVLDADALNIMSRYPQLKELIPAGSVLTPHMKEFDRLFGSQQNWFERLQAARSAAEKYQSVIVLKNQYTFIVGTNGKVLINPTGNPAMAQGGMGDVLTGMITAYLAQGLSAEKAAFTGCYVHGKSGDDLAENYFNISASQVARHIPRVVRQMIK